MDNSKQHFLHYIAAKVLVCRSCGYCIVPETKTIKRHLKDYHPELPRRVRDNTTAYAQSLSDLLADKIEDVQFPSQICPPFAELEILKDCFQCAACGWLCQTLKSMQQHCRAVHSWKSDKRRGGSLATRQGRDSNQMWTSGHSCQQFFKHTGWNRLFLVYAPITIAVQETPRTKRYIDMGSRLKATLDRKDEERRVNEKVKVNRARTKVTQWLDYTRWDQHLEGMSIARLKKSVQSARFGDEGSPEETEAETAALNRAAQSTGKLIWKAVRTSRPDHMPLAALFYVNRREGGQHNNEAPIYTQQMAGTMRKYGNVWVKVLRYIWRSIQWEKKPPYRLSQLQQDSLGEVRAAASTDWDEVDKKEIRVAKTKLEECLLAFYLAMLDHRLGDKEYDSALLSALAVIGLDNEAAGWGDVLNYTPKLAAIVTISRTFVLYRAYLDRQQEIKQKVINGTDQETAEAEVAPMVDSVVQMTNRMLVMQEFNGYSTPMDRILHMRAYGRNMRNTTKGIARVQPKDGLRSVCIDNTSFEISELRLLVMGLAESCRERLVRELCFMEDEAEMPRINIDALSDNAAQMTANWSFLDDPRNIPELELVNDIPHTEWLWRRILRNRTIRQRLIVDDDKDEITWLEDGIWDYYAQVRRFKEELIVLCHLTAGAPARGPEIISIQHQNSSDGASQRGVFIENGLVELVTTYHKGYSLEGNTKIIHRYVPREVGEVVLWYLWLVEPLVQILQKARGQEEVSSYLWEPEPEDIWQGEIDSDSDSDESRDGVQLRPEDVEELTISSDEEEEEDTIRVAGKQIKMVRNEPLNIDGFWNTERLKRGMKRESSSRIDAELAPAMWRQVYPYIQRTYCDDAEVGKMLDEVYANRTPEQRLEQSGHSRRMENIMYGVEIQENPFSTREEQRRFRLVSQRWHQFLMFPSAQGYTALADTGSRYEELTRRAEFERWRRIKEVDVRGELKRILGAQAEFRGIQQEGIETVMRREGRVLLVAGTGSGKSLIYMLPAMCSVDGVTIVIVPLTSLVDDQYRRCRAMGLRTCKWPDHKAARRAQVILIVPESAVTKAFGRFINEKSREGLLDRVVVDECHIILDSIEGWRQNVLQLCRLVEKGCQVVYMTATLPPADEEAFEESMGLKSQGLVKLRESTVRPNIAYRIMTYNESETELEDQAVQELVAEKLPRYTEQDKIIIYCQTIKQCKRLAEALQCPMYFREVGGKKEKRELLHELLHGAARVFCATNALGLGINAARIRVVIHMGIRSRMRDYAQESGRAGRDGAPAEAIIMRGYKIVYGREVLSRGRRTDAGMQEYLDGQKCRRKALDWHMDGDFNRVGCRRDEQRCDVCRGQGSSRHRMIHDNPASTAQMAAIGDNEDENEIQSLVPSSEPDEATGLGIEEDWEEEETTLVNCLGQGSQGLKRVRERSDSWLAEEKTAQAARDGQAEVDFVVESNAIGRDARQRRKHEKLDEAMYEDDLRRKLDQWKPVRCAICWVGGSAIDKMEATQQGQRWEACSWHLRSDTEAMEKAMQRYERVEFARFSGCQKCRVPQLICHSWQEAIAARGSRTASYSRVQGGRCQYWGLVQRMVCAYIIKAMSDEYDEESEAWKWVEEKMRRSLEFDRSDRGDERVEKLWRWIGVKVVDYGMESCNAVSMLYFLDEMELI